MSTLTADLQTAIDRHQAGDLPEAERRYRAILQTNPEDCEALHLLGVVAQQSGKHAEAIELITTAIDRAGAPRAVMVCNLGAALQAAGDIDAAIDRYEQSLALEPDYLDARHNLAAAYAARGQHERAVDAYQQVLERDPAHRLALINLAKSLEQLRRTEQAIACYRQAVSAHPGDIEALLNLGALLGRLGDSNAAENCFGEILQQTPEHALAHFNLGCIDQQRGRVENAAAHYRRAVASQPRHLGAWNNLGIVLKQLQQFKEAENCLREVVAVDPKSAIAHFNLGNLLREQERHNEAIDSYRSGLRLQPDHLESYINLGTALSGLGRLSEAEAEYQTALRLNPDYFEAHLNLASVLQLQGRFDEAAATHERAKQVNPACEAVQSNSLMLQLYRADVAPEEIFEQHRQWAGRFEARYAQIEPHPNRRDPERKLRIGYVSPDFRVHPVGFFIENILKHHDRAQFDVTCYAELPRGDRLTERICKNADRWRCTFQQPDDAVIRMIRADEIDILIDLAGHTSGNRLPVFAARPAPVQITYLGYGTTTGLPTMDYRLTDDVADPADERSLHTEELLRLPAGILCFAAPADAPDVSELPMQSNGHITFGSFNNLSKLSAPTLDLWAEVLRAVPESRLMLKNRSFADEDVRRRYQELFQQHGVEPDRVELVGPTKTIAEHLALYHRIDVGLDPFPYNGATTTCESLWMGVPVITLRGKSFVGRMSASLLTRVGLSDFITESPDAYLHRAWVCAAAAEPLAQLRRNLRPVVAASPLCDQASYVRGLEAAYRAAWRSECSCTSDL